ncbi:MAG: DUF362 domain-containing protein, partial [Deltaproteobacteria bacterium]|nr:DUF362 domain-containing protein [Deltaproteobacteria bacterium]
MVSGPRMAVERCDAYEPLALRRALRALLGALGGMGAFVSRGDRVLLKPNFLVAARAERCVTTHPELILAVAEAVLDAGATEVTVADSPAVGSARGVARRLGLLEPLAALGVEVSDLRDSVLADAPSAQVFRRFEVSRRVLDADRVINLAKLKTHGQMTLTMGLKNTFGAVVGPRKGAWHMEAGRDALLFARMLVELHR